MTGTTCPLTEERQSPSTRAGPALTAFTSPSPPASSSERAAGVANVNLTLIRTTAFDNVKSVVRSLLGPGDCDPHARGWAFVARPPDWLRPVTHTVEE